MGNKILYIEEDDDVRDSNVLNLQNLDHDFEIIEFLSGKKVIKKLADIDSPLGIIIGNQIAEGHEKAFIKNLIDMKLGDTLKVILLLDPTEVDLSTQEPLKAQINNLSIIQSSSDFNVFKANILKVFESNSDDSDLGYRKIKLAFFYRFNKVLCDVFVKLNKNKYIKIINSNEMYSQIIIEKYKIKGIQFFFIKTEDFDKFASSGETGILLKEIENAPIDLKIDAMASAYKLVRDKIKTVGPSEVAMEIADTCIKEMIQLNKDIGDLNELLKKMKDRNDYIYDHSLLVSYLCSMILENMKWKLDTNMEKLTYGAFFHDITLDDPELAQIMDKNDGRLNDYDLATVKDYESHPLHASQLVSESNKFPPDVDHLLAHHHERADGTGFPAKKGALSISQLIAIFIVAHRFVSSMYEVKMDESLYLVKAEEIEKNFNNGNFKEPVKALMNYVREHYKS